MPETDTKGGVKEMTFDPAPARRRHEEALKKWESWRPDIEAYVKQGLTQAQIAGKLGVSQNAVSRWMRRLGVI